MRKVFVAFGEVDYFLRWKTNDYVKHRHQNLILQVNVYISYYVRYTVIIYIRIQKKEE